MTEDVQANASAREDLCRFLSACYCEPTAAFAEERVFNSMLTAATAIHPDLAMRARKLGEAFAARDLEELLVDYTRLFLGPIKALASPYESAWLGENADPEQDSTAAVRELYEQGGFDVSEDFSDLPDHVAVELEFLYLLLFTQRLAKSSGNLADLAAVQLLQRRFLGEHLGSWIADFTATVKVHAETAFYRALAELTECFVRMETESPVTAAQ